MGTTSALLGGEIENYGSQHNVFNNLFTINFDGRFGNEDEWGLNIILGNEFNDENIRTWDYYASNFNFPGFPTIGNATNLASAVIPYPQSIFLPFLHFISMAITYL